MVTRRSHFTLAAAAAVAAVALGLYAADQTGLLDALLRVHQQTQTPVAPASPSTAIGGDPVGERVPTGNDAGSKDPVPAPESRQPTGAAVSEATLAQGTDAGADSRPSQGTTTPASRVAFEVATIRLVPPPLPTQVGPWTVSSDRFKAEAASVRDVIAFAEEAMAPQVKGGPEWVDRERYDFDARARVATTGPIRVMLRTLLTERFKLVFHRKIEEATVYTLVVAKSGSKLQDARGGQRNQMSQTRPGHLTFSGFAVPQGLTNVLTGYLGVAVLDETGLSGTYNFSLEFADPRDPRPGQVDALPDLITAVREQLGLELRPTKRWFQVIVIDRIERPSEY